jgi:hypothetical protein
MNGTELLPYWLIVRHERNRMEMLTVRLAGGGETLPVFSFEEEARVFCERGALGSGWRLRVTSTGELASVLLGLCAHVERVALDPLPLAGAEMLVALVSMRREDFVKLLCREKMSHDYTGDGRGAAKATSGRARFEGQLELDDSFSWR